VYKVCSLFKGTFVQAIYTCLDGVLRKKKLLVAEYTPCSAYSHKEFTQSKLYTNTHILGILVR